MKEAYRRGLTNNTVFMDEDFRITEEDTDQIYLDTSELDKIYRKNFSENPRLDRVRDLFIICCWTGLRFADLSQLGKDNIIEIDKEDFLKIKTQKTGETVIIPLHWTVQEILNKYNGDIPKVISNQKMNKYIKEVVKDSEITSNVRVAKTRAGKVVETSLPKHKLVTVHTARRSFASNMYLANFPTISIMKITGHRTERAFLKYIRISQEENAKMISKHSIWQAPLRIAE
jgi:integrase